MPKKASNKGGLHGLYPQNFPRSVRWRVDQDYLEQLSEEERAWLARFNDAWVGADFRGTDGWDTPTRRVVYREKNAANRDLYPRAVRLSEDGDLPETSPELADPFDPDPLPDYLESAGYKEAREAFRALLPDDLRYLPQQTPSYRAARRRLMELASAASSQDPSDP